MSRLHLVVFDQQGGISVAKEYRNSHRFYSMVWRELQEAYLKERKHPMGFFTDDIWEPTWKLVKDERLSYEERIVLACTFDYAIIKREQFQTLIDCFKAYSTYHETGHMWAIADDLRELMENEAVYGVGFEYSISDQWRDWSRRETGKKDEWGDDEYEYVWDFADERTYYPIDVVTVPEKRDPFL